MPFAIEVTTASGASKWYVAGFDNRVGCGIVYAGTIKGARLFPTKLSAEQFITRHEHVKQVTGGRGLNPKHSKVVNVPTRKRGK